MHIISQSRLKDFWLKHPQAKVGLQVWYKITSKARWQTPNDVQQVFANKVDKYLNKINYTLDFPVSRFPVLTRKLILHKYLLCKTSLFSILVVTSIV
jgi:mRNA-degrading endonuclease HigB of HigAB toxin-antitoxin module